MADTSLDVALAEIKALDDTGSSPACILPALLHVVASALLYEQDDCAEDAAAVILYASELAAKLEPGLHAARVAICQARGDLDLSARAKIAALREQG